MMSERRHLILVTRPPADDEHHVARLRCRSAKADGMAKWRGPIHYNDPDISTVLSLAKERDRQRGKYQYPMITDGLSDGFGGTLITDPPASSPAIQAPLAASH
jgi:hypothetical protein